MSFLSTRLRSSRTPVQQDKDDLDRLDNDPVKIFSTISDNIVKEGEEQGVTNHRRHLPGRPIRSSRRKTYQLREVNPSAPSPRRRSSSSGRPHSFSMPALPATPDGSRTLADGPVRNSLPHHASHIRDESAVVPRFKRKRGRVGRSRCRNYPSRPEPRPGPTTRWTP